MILAGDIGGTKCNLALLDRRDGGFQVRFREHFPTHEYARFEDMIDAFLRAAREASRGYRRRTDSRGRFRRCRSGDGPARANDQRSVGAGWRLPRTSARDAARGFAERSGGYRLLAGVAQARSTYSHSMLACQHPAQPRPCSPRARGWARPSCTGTAAATWWRQAKAATAISRRATRQEIELLRHMKKTR